MKTLNLAYPEKSDIKYRIDKFPDGQQQAVIISSVWNADIEEFENVKIKSRLNNFQDLELIICATKSLRNLGVKEIHLYTPYFLGSRSDRQFEEGSNNYLKDVICPIVNSLNFESVTVLDPHSDVLEACLNNFKKESNEKLVRLFYENLEMRQRNACSIRSAESFCNNTILVSPDAGASKKIYKLAESIGYKGDIITCSKDRDKDGKLTKTIVPTNANFIDKDVIIIDDICDGGATFINIVKEIRSNSPVEFKGEIYLIVTHGIFSKGFEELSKYFDGIYCTNSYQDLSGKLSGEQWNKDFVKQLNVF
jgi:ribose-phosphate pyrophosphokinase